MRSRLRAPRSQVVLDWIEEEAQDGIEGFAVMREGVAQPLWSRDITRALH